MKPFLLTFVSQNMYNISLSTIFAWDKSSDRWRFRHEIVPYIHTYSWCMISPSRFSCSSQNVWAGWTLTLESLSGSILAFRGVNPWSIMVDVFFQGVHLTIWLVRQVFEFMTFVGSLQARVYSPKVAIAVFGALSSHVTCWIEEGRLSQASWFLMIRDIVYSSRTTI